MSISLRDQFAAAALQGYCSQPDAGAWSHEHTATAAYQQADAMLAERDKASGELKRVRLAAQNMMNKPEGISVEKAGELILGLLDNYGVDS